MGRLPVVSGLEAVGAFERVGWSVHRWESSHISMKKPGHPALLTIPNHKPVKPGTLRSLIRSAEITVDEFVAALKG